MVLKRFTVSRGPDLDHLVASDPVWVGSLLQHFWLSMFAEKFEWQLESKPVPSLGWRKFRKRIMVIWRSGKFTMESHLSLSRKHSLSQDCVPWETCLLGAWYLQGQICLYLSFLQRDSILAPGLNVRLGYFHFDVNSMCIPKYHTKNPGP